MIGLKVFQDIKQVKIKQIEIQLFHVIDIVLHLLIYKLYIYKYDKTVDTVN